jgi:A/G-specific adenine glycosylase
MSRGGPDRLPPNLPARGAFAPKVIGWQRRHGRRGLPWQTTRDPYSIWVSEIMLQQTQVATVLRYYPRFIDRFATVHTLAQSPLDDVLAHWSGLGYYSRARNLHRAARLIGERHGGCFPVAIDEIAALPGIGRSTAAAISVFAYGTRHAILDGNVKRVLARVCAIGGYPGEREVSEALWQSAEWLLPSAGLEDYTQGLMDLGATVCTRRAPRCSACPVSEHCAARRDGRLDEIPAPRPHSARPRRHTVMLVLEHAGALLMERRAPSGVWGGLWSLPEVNAGECVVSACAQRFGVRIGKPQALAPVEHGFTHFSLTIVPQRARVEHVQMRAAEPGWRWFALEEALLAGIPAPVRRILECL